MSGKCFKGLLFTSIVVSVCERDGETERQRDKETESEKLRDKHLERQ